MSQSLVFVPSFTEAFASAHRVFQLIDRIPMIVSPNVSNKNRKSDKNNHIEYKCVDFCYPTRPDVPILKNFNLNVIEGKTIALVGPSGIKKSSSREKKNNQVLMFLFTPLYSAGCGKSTCIQLLLRLYDPERGRIRIGLNEISSDISLNDLRSKLSIVSQEPVLFEKTIAENIAYGDNSRDVSMDEIIAAAKVANVHNFINQLPMV